MVDSGNNTSPRHSGLLLVGHGTRNSHGLEEARLLADKVRAICPNAAVELCFLEMAAPDIAAGVERLVRSGVRHVRVMPLMLLAAGHVKQDIPAAVEAAAEALGDVRFDVCPPLGCHDNVLALSERRYREAVAVSHDIAVGDDITNKITAEETLLVLVARGNRDAEAQKEWRRFVENRRRHNDGLTIQAAYLAMAEPQFDAVLAAAIPGGYRRIVVQPHLLFAGQLLGQLQSQVASLAEKHRQHQWFLAQHLGPAQLLAEAAAQITGKAAMPQQTQEPKVRCIAKVTKAGTRT
ncbi:MAG: hypothetical protein IIA67_05270 [Planctomycetes bacterium]|nr:hypothetical protein [Planctomycetota bacterium]